MGLIIEKALSMSSIEQRERMHLMRELVRSRNVYRWAGQMLLDASRLRKKQRIIALTEQSQKQASGIIRLLRGAKETRSR